MTSKSRRTARAGTREVLWLAMLAGVALGASFASVTAGADTAGEAVSLFDGKTLAGWDAREESLWRVEEGAITGGSLVETCSMPRPVHSVRAAAISDCRT